MRPRSAETRVRIIEAALRAFGDAGFDGALTRTIAHNAGVQQPLINYHFGSKDGLWRASVDHLFGQLEARVAEAMPRLASSIRATRWRRCSSTSSTSTPIILSWRG